MKKPLADMAAARRHDAVALVGRNEHVYFAYQHALRRPARRTLVDDSTDLCVEAPPGSGNTYFVVGFTMANPKTKLAHHHHVAAQVQRAHRLGVPMMLIVRDPAACVLSRAVSWRNPAAIGPAYREWISFWRGALDCSDRAVVADFSAITADPTAVVQRLNRRFGREYSTAFPSRRDVFASMDRARAAAFSSFNATSGINPNRPDSRKDELKAWLGPLVNSHRLARRARELHERVLKIIDMAR